VSYASLLLWMRKGSARRPGPKAQQKLLACSQSFGDCWKHQKRYQQWCPPVIEAVHRIFSYSSTLAVRAASSQYHNDFDAL
jgi:hypothetical protein